MCIRDSNFITRAFLAVAGSIINTAAKAFGWVPGLGGKLREAAAKFNDFRDRVNRQLDGVKPLKVTVVTAQAKREMNDSIRSQSGRHLNVTVAAHQDAIGRNAVGTSFWSGGLTRINERGPGSEVVSLPRGSSITPASRLRNGQAAGGGDVHVTINGAMDPNAVAKQVQSVLLQLKRRNGGRELGIA